MASKRNSKTAMKAERDVGSSADEAEPQYKLDALLLTLSRADEQQHVSWVGERFRYKGCWTCGEILRADVSVLGSHCHLEHGAIHKGWLEVG